MYAAFDRYWDIYQDRSVRIPSPVGQAQYVISWYTEHAENSPNEWLLLNRFADTIGIEHGTREVRQLHRLAEYLRSEVFENGSGYVNPVVAIETEKEIILRSVPYYAEGLGHDITPTVRLLRDYEDKVPVFTQAERNLILTYAYFMGDAMGTERIAESIAAQNFSDRDIAVTCARIEKVNLEWSGLETLEGLETAVAEPPSFRFGFKDCEDPMKSYPRFTFYPTILPQNAELLQNGVVIQPCPDEPDRWQSALWKIDQTYMAPRYYLKTGRGRYEAAEYVDVDNPHDLAVSVSAGCSMSPRKEDVSATQKRSIRRYLKVAVREVGQRVPMENKSKGGEAR